MKTFSSTHTPKTAPNARVGALSDRMTLLFDRFFAFFQVCAGGFPSDRGAIQFKEVVIEEQGHHFVSSKSQINLFKKEF